MFRTRALQNNAISILLILSGALIALNLIHAQENLRKTAPVFYDANITIESRLSTTSAKDTVSSKVTPVSAPVPTESIPPVLVPPKVIFRVLPEYPSTALGKEIQGTVILAVYIGASGRTEKIEIKTSSGNEQLDGAAVKSVGMWRFEPARRGAIPISSWYQVPVQFRIGQDV